MTQQITLPFNCTPVIQHGRCIAEPSRNEIKSSPGLWNASLSDALLYGGDLTREVLGHLKLEPGRRKHIVVDVKVHMLMPGQCPAIPGWHVDGTPRHADGSPAGGGAPDFKMQLTPHFRPPIYHLLVTGQHCLTEFVRDPMPMNVEESMLSSPDIFAYLSRYVNEQRLPSFSPTSCEWTTWDWWAVHQGTISTGHEWRYLIRVAETDTLPPEQDLRNVLRSQQMVYSSLEFGW